MSDTLGYYSGEMFKIHKNALDNLKMILLKVEEEKESMKTRRKLAFSQIVGHELIPIVRTFSEEHDWDIFKSTIRYPGSIKIARSKTLNFLFPAYW